MILTSHAQTRAQQRAVPPLIIDWLNRYGEEAFDGRGGIRRYFSKRSRRALEHDCGRAPVRCMEAFLKTYLIESVDDGSIITVGHVTRRGFRR